MRACITNTIKKRESSLILYAVFLGGSLSLPFMKGQVSNYTRELLRTLKENVFTKRKHREHLGIL